MMLTSKLILPEGSRLLRVLNVLDSKIKLGTVKFFVEEVFRCSTNIFAQMTWEPIVLRYKGEVFDTDRRSFGTKVCYLLFLLLSNMVVIQ